MLKVIVGRHNHHVVPLGTSETAIMMTPSPRLSANQTDGHDDDDEEEMATLQFFTT